MSRDAASGTAGEHRESPVVVGLGASAGGLDALRRLIASLPEDLEVAVVVVQHLSPSQKSMLPDLLGSVAHLPVLGVERGMALRTGVVHVTAPGQAIELENGALRVPQSGTNHVQHPIDRFFTSMARQQQHRPVAVVLSGMATDGVQGLREVKTAGGITMAQDPSTARFDGMPRAAIETGLVDVVASPEDLADEIVHFARHPCVVSFGEHVASEQTPEADVDGSLDDIFRILRERTGVDFSHYKSPTIRRRLQRRMLVNRVDRVDHFVQLLERDPEEAMELHRDLLIHVTRFFREPKTFEVLKEQVFPKLVAEADASHALRVWVPGCATGEEPYSVAMALLECLGGSAHVPVQIFATDLSETAIEHARVGVYDDRIVDDVSEERLQRHFVRLDGGYRISQQVRDMCVFARQDLTRDPPFSHLDLVICRNVLIYLGPKLQDRLIHTFHYALREGGHLMLGSSETPGHRDSLFEAVDKKNGLYVRNSAARPPNVDFSFATRTRQPDQRSAPEPRGRRSRPTDVDRLLLDRYAPPSVLVNDELVILQARGGTSAYLQLPSGDVSLQLFKMAKQGLLHPLRAALQEASSQGVPVRREGVRVEVDEVEREIDVEVTPLVRGGSERHFLVIFDERSPQLRAASPVHRPSDGQADDERVSQLEQEVIATREHMNGIIHDLENTNEELQAANEEILSSNEELQSTNEELDTAKEELQSANEELNTVNDELHMRNQELSHVNGDLVNLVASVGIAIVMVDLDMRVRRFTKEAEEVFNLIGGDVGRPIAHIKANVEVPDLSDVMTDVIHSVTTVEREVCDREGRWYRMRVRPYKSLDNRIEGAVLVLMDIDALKRHEAETAAARDYAEAVVEMVRHPLVVLGTDLRVRSVNHAFADVFGQPKTRAEGRRIYDLYDGQWDVPALHRLFEKALPERRHVRDYEVSAELPGLGPRTLRVDGRQVEGRPGREDLILLAMQVEGPTEDSRGR